MDNYIWLRQTGRARTNPGVCLHEEENDGVYPQSWMKSHKNIAQIHHAIWIAMCDYMFAMSAGVFEHLWTFQCVFSSAPIVSVHASERFLAWVHSCMFFCAREQY